MPIQPPKKWRSLRSIRSCKAILDKTIRHSSDGAKIELDIGLAYTISEILQQAMWTEHGNTGET